MPKNEEVQVFRNALDQIVALDSNGRWRVYDTHTKSFGGFAKAPLKNAAVIDVMPLGAASEEPVATASSVQAEEIAQLRAEIAKMKELLEKAEAALREAVAKPKADPADVADLRAKLDAANKEKDDAVKAAREEAAKIAANKLADKEKEIGARDESIKKLEQSLKQEQEKPQTAYREQAFYERWYHNREWGKIGPAVAVALLLVFLTFNGVFHWTMHTPTSQPAQLASMPTDYDTMRSELAALKAKDEDRDKADKALAEAMKNRPPLVPLLKLDD